MKRFFLAAIITALATASFAEIKTKTFDYNHDGTVLEGFVAWDDSKTGPRPGVMIVHDWDGLNGYEQTRAKMLAELGYVGFAVDIYGKDSRPKTQQENGQQAGKYRGDLPLFRGRMKAALEAMKGMTDMVDPAKTAAIGYCFGGGGVLEMARAGMDVNGVVSFHGGLSTTMPATEGGVKSKVMVCHAMQDPSVPRDQFNKFLDEMRDAKVDYQLVAFNEDVHPFTVIGGPSYRPDADRRSWAAMQDFFKEIFG